MFNLPGIETELPEGVPKAVFEQIHSHMASGESNAAVGLIRQVAEQQLFPLYAFDASGHTLMHYAIHANDLQAVLTLIHLGYPFTLPASKKIPGQLGYASLSTALLAKRYKIAEALLRLYPPEGIEQTYNAEALIGIEEQPVLHSMIEANAIEQVAFLLTHGTNVHQTDRFGVPAISIARSPEMLLFLLDQGARVGWEGGEHTLQSFIYSVNCETTTFDPRHMYSAIRRLLACMTDEELDVVSQSRKLSDTSRYDAPAQEWDFFAFSLLFIERIRRTLDKCSLADIKVPGTKDLPKNSTYYTMRYLERVRVSEPVMSYETLQSLLERLAPVCLQAHAKQIVQTMIVHCRKERFEEAEKQKPPLLLKYASLLEQRAREQRRTYLTILSDRLQASKRC